MSSKSQNIDMIIFDLDDTLVCWKNGCELFPDVQETLASLKTIGYRIALASYNKNAYYYLKKFQIHEYFDFVVIEEFQKNFKVQFSLDSDNKKTLLQKLLNVAQTLPSRSLFFDDQWVNVCSGNSIGIKSVHVKENGFTKEMLYSSLKKYETLK